MATKTTTGSSDGPKPSGVGRHFLVAVPRDAAEATQTMRWATDNVLRAGDCVTLLHVRLADFSMPKARDRSPYSVVYELGF